MSIAGRVAQEKFAAIQERLMQLLPFPGDYITGVKGLTLHRREAINFPHESGFAAPHATVVFQGKETVLINGRGYTCGECQCRVNGKANMGTGYIADASPQKPFLAVSLALEPELLDKLVKNTCVPTRNGHDRLKAISVAEAEQSILDAFFRLVALLQNPAAIPFLATDIVLEIHFLILAGIHGDTPYENFRDESDNVKCLCQ